MNAEFPEYKGPTGPEYLFTSPVYVSSDGVRFTTAPSLNVGATPPPEPEPEPTYRTAIPLTVGEPSLRSTIQVCNDFDFSEELTREILWNTAYRLGRKHWYRGPKRARYGFEKFESLEAALHRCHFDCYTPSYTLATIWHGGYLLGRSRWHWGPSWMVTVRGWINTRLPLLKCYINPFHPQVGWLRSRPCTCHPTDRVTPCAQKYAASECHNPSTNTEP